MKRVLEDELISLAHRILKLKSRADIHQLKKEAGMLYEKLAVLSFAEKHFGGVKPTIGKTEFSDAFYSQYSHIDKDGDYKSPDGTEYNPEPISEPNTEKIKDIVSHMPPEAEQVDYLLDQFKKLSQSDFSDLEEAKESHQDTEIDQQKEEIDSEEHLEDKTQESVEEKADKKKTIEEKPTQEEEKQNFQTNQGEIDDEQPVDSSPKEKQESETELEQNTKEKASNTSSFEEDFGVHFDDLPFFEPKTEDKQENKPEAENNPHQEKKEEEEKPQPENIEKQQPKRTIDLFNQDKKSLNDRLQVGFQIGLNDRLAFTKALFDNNVEDYNRVMSQISTLNSYDEAQQFIEQNVKPEYSNWDEKPEVYQRFMSLLKRKFEA